MSRRLFAIISKMLGKKDFRVFLVFFFFSVVIWHIEKLRQDYTIVTELNVNYKDVPTGYTTPHDTTMRLVVKVTGNGFSLLRSQLSEQEATISLAGLRRLSSGGSTWAVYPPRQTPILSTTLPEHLRVTDIITDTLLVPLYTLHKKRLPIIIRDNVTIAPQHMMSRPVQFTPESVKVAGTNNLIDTMKAVYTVPLEPVELRHSMTTTMHFDLSDELIVDEHDVRVSYFVEPFTEKRVVVPISGIKVPEGYTAKFYPPSANITFSVGLSNFEAVTARDFYVVVNMEGVMPGDGTSRLRLEVADAPSFVKNVTAKPKFIEFLLEKEVKHRSASPVRN